MANERRGAIACCASTAHRFGGVAFIPSRAQHVLRDATVLKLHGKEAKWRVGLAWPSTCVNPVTTRFVSFVRPAMKGALAAQD
jgi:hypothetical protein